MRNPNLFRRWSVATAIVMAALSLPCWAQQGNIRTVMFVKVKLDRDESWKATAKDYAALMKKIGKDQAFTVWDAQSGPWQHAVVSYAAQWKELDDDQDPKMKAVAADVAKLIARLDSDTESGETWIDEMQPDLVISSQEVPKMVRTGRTRVMSGKMDEVLAILRKEAFPAVKKSGATSYGIAVARYGTPANEIHSHVGLNGMGDLDGPIGVQKGMSSAEYKAYLAKLQPLLDSTEWTLWKFMPDLSYIPAPK